MAPGMQQPEDPQGAILPIRATVFGANVSSIMRGVTGPRQSRGSSAGGSPQSTVLGWQRSSATTADLAAPRREAVRNRHGSIGMTARSSRSTDRFEPTILMK